MAEAKFVARCRLTLHDNLYYASRELGRVYETEKYLHNYGLTYALGLVKPAPAWFNGSQVPRYQDELRPFRVGSYYVTPARPIKVDFAFVTFKMATVPYYTFTPQVIENRVVDGRAKELAPGSVFEFFVFGDEKRELPHWIRLGKWMAKAELFYKWYAVGTDEARRVEPPQPQEVSCPLNPLDIDRHRLFTYDVVAMPPVSLLANPTVSGSCCRLKADEAAFGDTKHEDRFLPLNMSYFGGEVR